MGKIKVFDYENRIIGECENAIEASTVFEVHIDKVLKSIERNEIVHGLRFEKELNKKND